MQCGSDKIHGCRDAVTSYLTGNSSYNMAFTPLEIAVFVTVGLAEADGEPVDLTTKGALQGQNYSQVSAVCRPGPLHGSEAVSLTLMPGFTVEESSGGCLGTEKLGHKTAARAFVAARVTPPKPNRGIGCVVQGCPKGICLIGLHAPDGAIAASAAGTVKKVCGDMTTSCTVAVGDFGDDEGGSSNPNSPNAGLEAHLNTQFAQLGIGKLYSTTGFPGSRAAMSVAHTGAAMGLLQEVTLGGSIGRGRFQ
eukprot:SAG22_NODE_1013_length_6027_cov_4.804318_6_plen_250_part_00